VTYESTSEEAYLDRNLAVQVVAELALRLGFNAGIKERETAWPILYVDLPTGQVSWHIPSAELNGYFPDYAGEWDGHGVEEKRVRLRKFLERNE